MKRLFFIIGMMSLNIFWAQDVVNLVYKLEKKGNYPLDMNIKVKMKSEMEGQKVDVETNTKLYLDMKVVKLERGFYATEMTFSNLNIDMTTIVDGKKIEQNRVKEYVKKSIKELEKQKFSFDINDKGKLARVFSTEKNIDNSIREMMRSYKKEPIGSNTIRQVKEQLEGSFGEATIQSNLEQIIAVFPSRAVKVGDSWEVSSFLTSTIPEKINTTYTLVEANKDYILITGKSDINLAGKKIFLVQGQEMYATINGDITSELRFDAKTNWIKKAMVKQNMKGEMKIGGDRSHPEGKTIPIDSYSETMIGY